MTQKLWTERCIVRIYALFENGEENKFATLQLEENTPPRILYKNDGVLERLVHYIETEGYGK